MVSQAPQQPHASHLGLTPTSARQTPAPARPQLQPGTLQLQPDPSSSQAHSSSSQAHSSSSQTPAPARHTPARQILAPARQIPATQTLYPPSGQTSCTARQIAPPTDVGLRSVFTMLMELKNEQKAMHRQMRKFGMLLAAIRDEGVRSNT
ncbi:uncharacterized protein [Apostichopus japonicus]|uniref:uncharacterized protein n=1 Tax=Stichopus japonicus TaxID=307972 RepID=UPI003AB61C99